MIIDAHTHLNKTNDEPDFLRAANRLLVEADENGVDKIVVIANTISGTNCASTEEIIDGISDNDRFMVIGSPNIMDENKTKLDYLEELLKNGKIIGLKLFPGHEKFYPTDDRCTLVYELAIKYNCPIVIHTGINIGDFDCAKYNDPQHIIKVAQKYPSLRIVIAHYFWPKIDYCFEVTSNVSNIYYDISAMADDEVMNLSGGFNRIKLILERTNRIKSNSIIFGTDYDMCSQKKHIELIKKINISNGDKQNIFANNFMKCFNKTL